jgi:hypothetical protein
MPCSTITIHERVHTEVLPQGIPPNPGVADEALRVGDGYARLKLAQLRRRETLLCLEYELSAEDALRWLIKQLYGLTPVSRVRIPPFASTPVDRSDREISCSQLIEVSLPSAAPTSLFCRTVAAQLASSVFMATVASSETIFARLHRESQVLKGFVACTPPL